MNNIRFNGARAKTDFSCLKISGDDSSNYLQGQTTNNIFSLNDKSGHLNSIINIQGKIEYIFYTYRYLSNSYLIIAESQIIAGLKDRLERSIISEDVEVEKIDLAISCLLGENLIARISSQHPDSTILAQYFGDRVLFILDEDILKTHNIESIDPKELNIYCKLNAFFHPIDTANGLAITSITMGELLISMSKGCYIGQEIVSKIINNRGSANYQMYMFLDKRIQVSEFEFGQVIEEFSYESKWFYSLKVKREFYIDNKILENNIILRKFPFFKNDSLSKSISLFDIAIDLYHQNNIPDSLNNLKLALELNPNYQDAYEILSVITSRTGDNKEAITTIKKLIDLNPDSIMAHTNLSFFYMQDGQKELAEEEKSIAIGLQMNLEPDNLKIDYEDLARREKMFFEVLEIDDADDLAIKGILEIYSERGEFVKIKEFTTELILKNIKTSIIYFRRGLALQKLNDKPNALNDFNLAVSIAAKKGETKFASEIQQIINNI